MFIPAIGHAITVSSFTSIGDMTTAAGLSAAFTGEVSKLNTASARANAGTSAYIGKTFNNSYTIGAIHIFGSNDLGFVNAIDPTVTATVYGKNGTAPANATDGTSLGSNLTVDGQEAVQGYGIYVAISNPKLWNHVWVNLTHNGAAQAMYCAELVFYKVWNLPIAFGAAEPLPYSLLTEEYYNDLKQNHFNQNCPCFLADNTNPDAAVTADYEADGFPASNTQNQSTGLKWKSTSLNTQFIYVDGEDFFNCVGIAGHNFATEGIQVSIEHRPSGMVGYYTLTTPEVPIDDGPLMFLFPMSDQGGYRIRLGTGGGTANFPEAAVIYGGIAMFAERKIYVGHSPLPSQFQMNVVSGISESGHFLGRIILGKTASTSIELIDMSADFYRYWFTDFLNDTQENGFPFFFAWRPTDYANETGFCWLTNNPQPTNQRSNGMMNVTLEVNGMVRPEFIGDPLIGVA